MLNIDGLITGLDTSSIIDGLLQIQQRQINTLNERRAQVLTKQGSFSGVEARLLSLRGALGRLSSIHTTAMNDKVVTSSHEDALAAAASDNAVPGTYRLHVDQLATAHQLATTGFSGPDAEIGTGSVELRVGNQAPVMLVFDDSNNTVQGFVDAVNASGASVTASLINDGSGEAPYRIMLTANQTGAENQIQLSSALIGIDPSFLEVQEALNSRISFGSGLNALSVENSTNSLADVIAGVTMELKRTTAPGEEITLTVGPDVESATGAVQELVDAYNDFVNYVNEQVQYNPDSQQAGLLLGERSVVEIQDTVRLALSSVVPGLGTRGNRASSIGITFNDDGTARLDPSRLERILRGQDPAVPPSDLARLFALGADSSNPGIYFVSGSTRTETGDVQVNITDAARQAVLLGSSSLAESIVIDSSNDSLTLKIDGQQSGALTLSHGTYTSQELTQQLQAMLDADAELLGREVTVSLQDGALQVRSNSYGSASSVEVVDGTALATLGLSAGDSSRGLDVVGHFLVNGQIEEATGRGTLLVGSSQNAHTADLQVRVRLTDADLVDGPDGTLVVTRGLAADLDKMIGAMVDSERGKIKTVNQRFDETSASIQKSIDRLNAQFESQRESLIRQFTALESAVNELQTTGSYLASQFAGLTSLVR